MKDIQRYGFRFGWEIERKDGEWMKARDVLPELERLRAKVKMWEDIEFAPGLEGK